MRQPVSLVPLVLSMRYCKCITAVFKLDLKIAGVRAVCHLPPLCAPQNARFVCWEPLPGGLSQTFQRTIADAVAIRERKFAFAVKTRKPEMNPERFIPGRGHLFCDTQAYYKEKDRLVDEVLIGIVSGIAHSHRNGITGNYFFTILERGSTIKPVGFLRPVVVAGTCYERTDVAIAEENVAELVMVRGIAASCSIKKNTGVRTSRIGVHTGKVVIRKPHRIQTGISC